MDIWNMEDGFYFSYADLILGWDLGFFRLALYTA